MKKNKLFKIFAILVCICIFSVAAIAGLLGCKAVPIKEKIDVEETEKGFIQKPVEEEKEAPAIELEIYEGPVYSQADNICFYRVKTIVTGFPIPEVEFSRDDSNGALGKNNVQVNLNDASDTYILSANAFNSEGITTSSITLTWGCGEPEIFEEKIHNYSKQEIEYFFETAIGAEFGESQPEIHKWMDNIRIKVIGSPTSADLDSLNQVITELSSLITSISFDIVIWNSNIDFYFTTMDQFASIEPDYVPGNMGFFWGWWDYSGVIYKGKILIAVDGVSQQERSHLIREELTQCLGIMNDSYRYKDSIFYQGWTDTINYAPIDRAIISLLYDSRLKPGMAQDQVRDMLDIP